MFKDFWFYFNFIPFALGILFTAISIMVFTSLDHTGLSYTHTECAGANETVLDSEGWSAMDFCVEKKMSEDLAYPVLLFFTGMLGIIFIIPLAIYLLLSLRKFKYGHY
jgi:hypothetical protein